MNKPLLTRLSFDLIPNQFRIRQLLLVSIFLSLGSYASFGQPIFGTSECQCLDNASLTGNDGQFGETIFITDAVDVPWTIVSTEGFYDITSPAPPATPIDYVAGSPVPQIAPGSYALDGIRITGTEWTVTLNDGTTDYVLSSIHICNYPTEEILGDFGVCADLLESYTLNMDPADIVSATWTLNAGGTILTGQGTETIQVLWDNTPGTYDLSVTGQARAFPTQNNDFCSYTATASVEMASDEPVSMACNNVVNLSLNGTCELEITADMMLEDPSFTNPSYEIEILDIEADTIIPNGIIPMDYLGKTLQVTVIQQCGGNSCWGYVNLEDKSIPQLDCGDDVTIDCNQLSGPEQTGFPVDPSVVVTPLGNDEFLLEGYDQCSDVILTYFDEVDASICQGPYSSVITRTFVVTDVSGNTSSCETVIYINRVSLADVIVMPESYDDVLGTQPSIEACSGYPTLPNGHPHPDFTGYPTGIICIHADVRYTDTKIDICGENAFKIRRRWQVTDLCTYEDSIYNQTITVMDTEAPECVNPAPFTIGTTGLTCASNIEVPVPEVINECSDYEYFVSYKIKDNSGDPYSGATSDGVIQHSSGSYIITGIPAGAEVIWIVYTFIDDCDNVSQCFTEATIVDNVQPIPVCDLHTFVAVNEDGYAYAEYGAFDDGSWDNCSIDYIEIRRMDNFSCNISNNWGEKAKFCCDDIGDIVMVQLRVVDHAGNSNTCMVEVEVQDNTPPVFTYCPPDITIDCSVILGSDLSAYGVATATDNCNVTIMESRNEIDGNCLTGVVTRTFTAKDEYGNETTCQQRITKQALDPFYINPNNSNDPFDDVVWPRDYTISNGCLNSSLDPENLPQIYGFPQIFENPCSNVGVDYDDVVFQYVDGYCFKVLRTWTIYDWCQFNPFLPNVGKWEYTQVLKVQNSIAPTFISGCSAGDVNVTQIASCQTRIEVEAFAEDDCSDMSELEFRYEIDIDNNGGVDLSGNGNSINRVVSYGTHRITFYVEDECGNETDCTYLIMLDDQKAPTPYCLSEVVVVIDEETKDVTVWASDFDQGSFDNCSSDSQLDISFSTNVNDIYRTFSCSDLEGSVDTFELQVYVTDPQGNRDFCTTMLIVQDNMGVCNEPATRVNIEGSVFTEEEEMLEEVEVSLSANLPEYPLSNMTEENGHYAFSELAMYNDYNVEPSKSGDPRGGISTLDLVMIQRHVLGISKLNSPYKVIAADINDNSKISASDLVDLRKLILGIYEELPSNSEWRFVDAAYEFIDAEKPFPFAEQIALNDIDSDMMSNDFVAVKIGDVNGSYTPGLQGDIDTDNRSVKSLKVDNQTAINGELLKIDFTAEDIEGLVGMQFTLEFDASKASYYGILSGSQTIGEQNLGLANVDRGLITLSWNTIEPVSDSDVLFSMEFLASEEVSVQELIKISDHTLNAEVYASAEDQLNTYSLNLNVVHGESQLAEARFELYQNVPNPFKESTEIAFNLPEQGIATISVFDVSGKEIFSKTGEYLKGYNVVEITRDDILRTGILYYQLETKTHISSKKMIVIR